MAQVILTIPNEKLQGIIDAFAKQYNYPTMVPDPNNPTGGRDTYIPNPMSEGHFAKLCILNFVKQVYISQQAKAHDAAIKATIDAAKSDADTIIVE